jgi:DnaJ-class molecular chaperone
MGLPDIQIELESGAIIDLREAAVALREKKVARKRKRLPCEHCEGDGKDKNGEDCKHCDGTGKSPYRASGSNSDSRRGDIELFESALGMNHAAAKAAARGR